MTDPTVILQCALARISILDLTYVSKYSLEYISTANWPSYWNLKRTGSRNFRLCAREHTSESPAPTAVTTITDPLFKRCK